jgi:23S rRNA (guanosine2251-2'-O)-methyltransferase
MISKKSQQHEEHWIWGVHAVLACAQTQPELLKEIFLIEAKAVDSDVKSLLNFLSDLGLRVQPIKNIPVALKEKRTQGVVAQLQHFPLRSFQKEKSRLQKLCQEEIGQWVFLDRIQDPQNYGAILRSAAAFGLKGVFVGTKDQCPVTGTVAQVSAGQLFRVDLWECHNPLDLMEMFKEADFEILALEAGGQNLSRHLEDLKKSKKNILWLLGAEHFGVQKRYVERSSASVSIPMKSDVESLNVSNAAAIAFFEAQKNYLLS